MRLPSVVVLAGGSLLLGLGTGTWLRGSLALRAPSEGEAPVVASDRTRSPALAERRFQEGVRFLDEERFGGALAAFERAAELDPTDPRPHHGRANVFRSLFVPGEQRAERALRHALELDPSYTPSRKALAKLLYDESRYLEAKEQLERLLEENPADDFVRAELAMNLIELGRSGDALPLLLEYNERGGDQAWGHTQLGRAYQELGDLPRAEASYRRAAAANSYHSPAFYRLGQLLASVGRPADATPFLQRYRHLRDLQNREHELALALQRDPDEMAVLVELARVRTELGKREKGLATLARALALAPGDRRLQALRARLEHDVEGRQAAGQGVDRGKKAPE